MRRYLVSLLVVYSFTPLVLVYGESGEDRVSGTWTGNGSIDVAGHSGTPEGESAEIGFGSYFVTLPEPKKNEKQYVVCSTCGAEILKRTLSREVGSQGSFQAEGGWVSCGKSVGFSVAELLDTDNNNLDDREGTASSALEYKYEVLFQRPPDTDEESDTFPDGGGPNGGGTAPELTPYGSLTAPTSVTASHGGGSCCQTIARDPTTLPTITTTFPYSPTAAYVHVDLGKLDGVSFGDVVFELNAGAGATLGNFASVKVRSNILPTTSGSDGSVVHSPYNPNIENNEPPANDGVLFPSIMRFQGGDAVFPQRYGSFAIVPGAGFVPYYWLSVTQSDETGKVTATVYRALSTDTMATTVPTAGHLTANLPSYEFTFVPATSGQPNKVIMVRKRSGVELAREEFTASHVVASDTTVTERTWTSQFEPLGANWTTALKTSSTSLTYPAGVIDARVETRRVTRISSASTVERDESFEKLVFRKSGNVEYLAQRLSGVGPGLRREVYDYQRLDYDPTQIVQNGKVVLTKTYANVDPDDDEPEDGANPELLVDRLEAVASSGEIGTIGPWQDSSGASGYSATVNKHSIDGTGSTVYYRAESGDDTALTRSRNGGAGDMGNAAIDELSGFLEASYYRRDGYFTTELGLPDFDSLFHTNEKGRRRFTDYWVVPGNTGKKWFFENGGGPVMPVDETWDTKGVFREIDSSGDITEYAQVKDFNNWSNSLFIDWNSHYPDQQDNIFPAWAGAFDLSLSTSHLAAGGTLATTDLKVPSGGPEVANRIAGKTTRQVRVSCFYGPVYDGTLVWNGTNFETVTFRVYFYDATSHKLSRVDEDGIVAETYDYTDPSLVKVTTRDGVTITRTLEQQGKFLSTDQQTTLGVPANSTASAQADITTTRTRTLSGTSLIETSTRTGGTFSLSSTATYGPGNVLESQTDESGITTTYAEGPLSSTTTRPGNVTRTDSRYLDGTPKSVTGNATVPTLTTRTVTQDGILETVTSTDGGVTRTLSSTLTSGTGLVLRQTTGGVGYDYTYDHTGRRVSRKLIGDPTAAAYRWVYDYRGVVIKEGYDMNNDGQLTAASTDTLTEHDEFFEKDGAGQWWQVSSQAQYTTNGEVQPKDTVITRSSIGGGATQIRKVLQANGTEEVTTTVTDRSNRTVTQTTTSTGLPGKSAVTLTYNGRVVSSRNYDASVATTYTYDDLGRNTGSTGPAVGSAELVSQTTAYDPTTGVVTSVTDAENHTTSYEYYPPTHASAGQLRSLTRPGPAVERYAYNTRGQMTEQWGDAAYPVRYVYSGFGDLTQMKTFKTDSGATAWLGAADGNLPASFDSAAALHINTTTWTYDGPTGRLTGKTEPGGYGGDTYTYDAAGRLEYSLRMRGGGKDAQNAPMKQGGRYSYDPAGRVSGINYNVVNTLPNTPEYDPLYFEWQDGYHETPDVAFTYDRLGRPVSRTDAAGTTVIVHRPGPGIASIETTTGGLQDGLILTHKEDAQRRPTGVVWKLGTNGVEQETTYSYDAQGRLSTAALGTMSASYNFAPTAPYPVATVTRPLNGPAGALTGTLQHDPLGRLSSQTWATAAASVASFGAQYDAANRRTHIQREGGITQRYGYNDRGEVTSAWKEDTANAQTLEGWTQGYQYDDIGNRTQITTPEGETLAWDTAMEGVSYGNTYAQLVAPKKHYIRVRTKTPPPVVNSVTIDGQNATVDGEWWRALVDATPWPTFTRHTVNIAVNATGGGTTKTSTQQRVLSNFDSEYYPTADEDGNFDSINDMHYRWDAQNRLVSAESSTWPVQKGRTIYDYDAYGRRIRKRHAVREQTDPEVWQWWVWPYVQQSETVFIWDGWTLLGEYERTDATAPLQLRRSYLWGLDLVASASEQSRIGAAGGVGGLLWVNEFVPGQSTSFRQLAPWYDLNGNVMGWMENSTAGSRILHRQEYDAFGQLIIDDTLEPVLTPAFQAAGATHYLDRPPIGFSTKYEDAETGFLYYGYRYYSAEMGRWLSRDPIEERGGINLYGMVRNDAVNRWDYLGLEGCKVEVRCGPVAGGMYHCGIYVNGTEFGIGGGPRQWHGQPALFTPTGVPPEYANDAPAKAPEGIRTYPGTCKCPCDVVKKCMKDHQANTDPPEYAAISGPNSNTYAHRLLHHCECSVDPIHIPEYQPPSTGQSPSRPMPIPAHDTTTPPDAPNWDHPDFDNYPPNPSPSAPAPR